MIEKEVTIINKLGLHARAATKLAKLAGSYEAKIQVAKDQATVDGKSVMSLMLLAANRGTDLRIIADGDDENEAMAAIESLINNRFDEEE